MAPVSPYYSSQLRYLPPISEPEYSQDDEYLSFLPEGWSITSTLVERDG